MYVRFILVTNDQITWLYFAEFSCLHAMYVYMYLCVHVRIRNHKLSLYVYMYILITYQNLYVYISTDWSIQSLTHTTVHDDYFITTIPLTLRSSLSRQDFSVKLGCLDIFYQYLLVSTCNNSWSYIDDIV